MYKNALLAAAVTALLCVPAQAQIAPPPDMQPAVDKMESYLHNLMETTRVPGAAVGIVYQGHVIFLKGYGVRTVGEAAKVDEDTVFEIASLSKPLASTVVATLVGRGVMHWDDKIQTLDPGFALSNQQATEQVTVRDLFAHRSGLPTGAGDMLEDLGYSRPEILKQLRLVPLAGAFRETYHYSNFGLTEGAIAASRKTGKTWEDLSQELLYERIGMHSTSSRFSDYRNRANKASLHYLVKDGVYQNWFEREADAEAPAGGVSSSVRDLANFMLLQLGEGSFQGQQIVDKAALEETHKPEICAAAPGPVPPGECNGIFYGLGWNVGKDRTTGALRLNHSGAFDLGSATTITLAPDKQLGIVVLTNGTPIGIPESICQAFLDFVEHGSVQHDYPGLFKPIFEKMIHETEDAWPDYAKLTPPSTPAAAANLSAYAGTYESPYYGKLVIEVERNQLVMRLPPRGAFYELTHWDKDTFTYHFASESTGVGRRGVVFLQGGKQLLVQSLAFAGIDGTFTRVVAR